MKVLINGAYGGFSLCDELIDLYTKRTGKSISRYETGDEIRYDADLIDIVERREKESHYNEDDLRVVEIRPGYEQFHTIDEYDGLESIQYNEKAYALHQTLSVIYSIATNSGIPEADRLTQIKYLSASVGAGASASASASASVGGGSVH